MRKLNKPFFGSGKNPAKSKGFWDIKDSIFGTSKPPNKRAAVKSSQGFFRSKLNSPESNLQHYSEDEIPSFDEHEAQRRKNEVQSYLSSKRNIPPTTPLREFIEGMDGNVSNHLQGMFKRASTEQISACAEKMRYRSNVADYVRWTYYQKHQAKLDKLPREKRDADLLRVIEKLAAGKLKYRSADWISEATDVIKTRIFAEDKKSISREEKAEQAAASKADKINQREQERLNKIQRTEAAKDEAKSNRGSYFVSVEARERTLSEFKDPSIREQKDQAEIARNQRIWAIYQNLYQEA